MFSDGACSVCMYKRGAEDYFFVTSAAIRRF